MMASPKATTYDSDQKVADVSVPSSSEPKSADADSCISGIFSRAAYVDAKHAVFNDIRRDQFNIDQHIKVEIKVCL
jgi:hypothetical protein